MIEFEPTLGKVEREAIERPLVVLYGCHEIGYPRNATVARMLLKAGFQVEICHSRKSYPFRHLDLLRQFGRFRRRAKFVWVTEGGYRLVPLLKATLLRSGVPIVYDPFISRYDTYVQDRATVRPGSLEAAILTWHDWSSTHAADALVFDTRDHQEYFFRRYSLDSPAMVLPVSIREDLFVPPASFETTKAGSGPVRVLFYGTFIPLQGIEQIVRAAALLHDRQDVVFRIVGAGQTREGILKLHQELGKGRIEWLDPVPEDALGGLIREADICLGVFGTSDKAGRVVPNKVVQAAAMGKAIVTRASHAMEEYFQDGRSIRMCAAGDPDSLASAIVELAQEPASRARLGAAAREVFQRNFSLDVNAGRLGDWLRSGFRVPVRSPCA